MVALQQAIDTARFRRDAYWVMQQRYTGMMQTVWGSAERFMNQVDRLNEQGPPPSQEGPTSAADCFIQLMTKMDQIESDKQYRAKK